MDYNHDTIKSIVTHDVYFKGYIASGVKQAQFSRAQIDGIQKFFQQDNYKGIRNVVHVRDWLVKANDIVEMFARLKEYHATFKEAGTPIEKADKNLKKLASQRAADIADITENFGRSGILEKSLNRGTVPFFNPVMQGVSKVYRMGEDATANGIKGWVALSTTKKEPLQVLFSSVCY